jgi:hypothetical protein
MVTESLIMLTDIVKRGFGPGRTKEYFVVQADGDTLGSILAGPFENSEQCLAAIEALRTCVSGRLTWIAGHLAREREWVSPL